MNAPASPITVNVVVEEAARDRIADVASALGGAGMTVTETLEELGIVCGTVAEDRLPALRNIEGVAIVERSQRHSL